MVKYSTLIVVLGVMALSIAVFATNADGSGIVWRAINKSGSSLFDIANVAFTSCSNGQVLQWQTSNSTWICATSSSGYTKVNNVDTTGGTASILATNATLSSTQATFKTITGGTGITLTNGTKTVTVSSSITQGYTKLNNVDTTVGTASILATNVTATSTQATFKTITAGTAMTLSNGTKTVTINNNGVTSLTGTANNVTVSASTGAVTLNTGSNIVITGGSSQTFTKKIFTNGFGMNYTKTSTTTTNTGTTAGIHVVDAATTNRTVNLPTASGTTGQLFFISRNDTTTITTAKNNKVIIDASGTEKIDSNNMYNLTRNGQTVLLQSTGTGWTVIQTTGFNNGDPFSVPVKGTTMNRWYGSWESYGTLTTSGQKANTITATPFPLSTRTTFDSIQLDIVTAKQGNCRTAIYTDNGNGYPDKLVNGTDPAQISVAAGTRVGNTFGTQIALNPGLYWLAVNCSVSSSSLRALPTSSVPTTLGYSSASPPVLATGWNATFTFAAFPNNFPIAGAAITTHTPVMVMVRAAG